tara:strand:- start:1563 stop:1910 length:348 start_codon:yes stop_codon:yes gene_type:complete
LDCRKGCVCCGWVNRRPRRHRCHSRLSLTNCLSLCCALCLCGSGSGGSGRCGFLLSLALNGSGGGNLPLYRSGGSAICRTIIAIAFALPLKIAFSSGRIARRTARNTTAATTLSK